jgi:hypothetical protein
VLGSYSAFICILFFFLVCSLRRSVAVNMQEHRSVLYVVCTCVSRRMTTIPVFYTRLSLLAARIFLLTELGGDSSLRNVGELLSDYTASYPKRQCSSYSPLR